MCNHGYNIACVGFRFLYTSDYSDRLSEMCKLKEGSLYYDSTGCPSVKHELDFKSTIFLAVSGEEVEGIHFKT